MDVYPIKSELAKDLENLELPDWLKAAAVSTVGEYEHGTADVESVEDGTTLCIYKSVLLDFLLSIANYSPEEKK